MSRFRAPARELSGEETPTPPAKLASGFSFRLPEMIANSRAPSRRRSSSASRNGSGVSTLPSPRSASRGSRSSSSAAAPRSPSRLSTTAAPHSPPLATYKQLTKRVPHLADSEYITGYYRHASGFSASLRSLLRVHNETANIYTHACGFFVCLWLLVHTLLAGDPASLGLGPSLPPPPPPPPALPLHPPCAGAPLWPLAVFLCGALVCLGCSVAFHAFAPVSPRVFAALAKADYVGISALIFTSMVPPLVYSFWDDAPALRAYLALAATTNAAAAAAGLTDRFRTPAWRWARASAFVACGVVGVAPLLHALWAARAPGAPRGAGDAAQRSLRGTVLMGAQYLVGALMYAARVPERWAPGSFDLFGSHAIFHVLVVTAVLTHWTTAASLHGWRDGLLCRA